MYMRTDTFAKLFFLVSLTGLLMYGILAFYSFHTSYTTVYDVESYHTPGLPKPAPLRKSSFSIDNQMKYILIWTTPEFQENPLGFGQEPFVRNNCSFRNCYISLNKQLHFDVVILDIGVLRRSRWKKTLPQERSPEQMFVFHSMRSADETPICNVLADSYFNWTWSYKIYSDISTPFIEVKDLEGKVVAPGRNVQWIESTKQLPEVDVDRLKTKKKAVAWMPESCHTRTNRFVYVKRLQEALKERSLELDVFGCLKDTLYACPKEGCAEVLERDYYFYLAYEASHAEDYVTTDVLKAYHHNSVPIVKGGADYKFFLPEGSYIDASTQTPENLATLIDYSIKNPSVYHSFHQWRYHYTIGEGNHNKGICDLCEMVNNRLKVTAPSNYEYFRKWWYKNLEERCYPKGAEEMKDVISYMNETRRKRVSETDAL